MGIILHSWMDIMTNWVEIQVFKLRTYHDILLHEINDKNLLLKFVGVIRTGQISNINQIWLKGDTLASVGIMVISLYGWF